jgi:pimeloyl-ACP methyl ester carboxylesterase
MNHRIVESNGIKMHLAEDGEGPLVVLCHGWPELWYSWRHQLKPLAEAGYRVVAPDQRGYGQTDRPEAVEDYNILQLSGDIIGLVDALGETEAVIVGHDWYRNIDGLWELTPFLSGAKIRQSSLFVAGEFDGVITIYRQAFDSLEETMPGLRKKVLVPGAGHWIQQEHPNEVNDLLIEFLASL